MNGYPHQGLTEQVIGAAIEVHKALGPGLLESAYEQCLCHELDLREVQFEQQVQIAVQYKQCQIECGYRADVVVQRAVLLELKSVEKLTPVHEAQLITYLKLSGLKVGLLINFNEHRLRDGLVRRVV